MPRTITAFPGHLAAPRAIVPGELDRIFCEIGMPMNLYTVCGHHVGDALAKGSSALDPGQISPYLIIARVRFTWMSARAVTGCIKTYSRCLSAGHQSIFKTQSAGENSVWRVRRVGSRPMIGWLMCAICRLKLSLRPSRVQATSCNGSRYPSISLVICLVWPAA